MHPTASRSPKRYPPALLRALLPGLVLALAACAQTGTPAPSSGSPGSTADSSAAAGSPTRSASGEIEVEVPARGEQVAGTFEVKGKARVFEGRVNYRLRAQGQVLTEGSTQAQAPDAGQFGPFQIALTWTMPQPPGTPAELEVFAIRAKDGVPDHVVTIPLILK
jgi:hypothetical protein